MGSVGVWGRFHALFKYVVSGGSSACANLAVLYLLTEYAHVHYLLSAILAFILSFLISFLLQKFWTFKDLSKEGLHWQMIWYFVLSLVNLVLNTLLIYFFVEYVHLWYVMAAIIAGGLLAISNFFVYKHVIFSIQT